MTHLLFIDPIDKLNIKKDSSLMLGIALKELGHDVYLLFEKDFCVTSEDNLELDVYTFSGQHADDGYYLKNIELGNKKKTKINSSTMLHMRIDPPYDIRYHRYLWMLDFMQHKFKAKITNNPLGIMKYNEKLTAIRESWGVRSFVGSSESEFKNFVNKLKDEGHNEIVLKPMDLYSGIGVTKHKIDDYLLEQFRNYVKQYHGAVLAQPFMQEVLKGEHRSLFFRGIHFGTIIKIPNKGDFITNIAQGATYQEASLSERAMQICIDISSELLKEGIDFIAFDILGDKITELNITCPGLIVEVSYACKKNIAHLIAQSF